MKPQNPPEDIANEAIAAANQVISKYYGHPSNQAQLGLVLMDAAAKELIGAVRGTTDKDSLILAGKLAKILGSTAVKFLQEEGLTQYGGPE